LKLKIYVKIYNKGKTNEFCALKGIDLSIEEGEMVAIIGKSGAGKSTLLHILAAIDSYDKGSYLVDGVSVGDLKEKDRARFRNQKIGIVMQDYALIDEYTIEENASDSFDFWKSKGKRCTKGKNYDCIGKRRSCRVGEKACSSAFRRSKAACGDCTCPCK